jgi:hypothetical protein
VQEARTLLVFVLLLQVCCQKPGEGQRALKLQYLHARFERVTAPVVPSYRFTAGQRLDYRTECRFPSSYGTEVQTRFRTVWVISRNADSSWRVVMVVRAVGQVPDSSGRTGPPDTSIQVAYADMRADGSHVANPTLVGEDPMMFFPQMPLNASQAGAGWTFATGRGRPPSRCTLLGMDEKNPKLAAVLIEMGSATDPASSREVASFDTALGLMRHKEGQYHMPQQWKGTGTAVGDLDSVILLSPSRFEGLKRDADGYFQTWLKSKQLLYLAHSDSARADSVDIELESLYARTGRVLNEPLLREALGRDLTALRGHLRRPKDDE